ncbi:acetyltransferase [Brevibacillus laterosporus]|uniref:Acetyltransferase n=1 Tax=Brevibacillus laterosporus TaxID=1465 RepID=A0A518V3M0_BRELA|nr:acetyltransferase [Brevibacillus laterosporus]
MNKDTFVCLVRHSLPPSLFCSSCVKDHFFFPKLLRCCTMLLFLTYY